MQAPIYISVFTCTDCALLAFTAEFGIIIITTPPSPLLNKQKRSDADPASTNVDNMCHSKRPICRNLFLPLLLWL